MNDPAGNHTLTYRDIFALWFPLALSGQMMSISAPIISAGISRLPDATVNLGAYGFIMSIAVLIESPVIMILSASVALVRSRESYLIVRRFVTHLSIGVTSMAILVYFTPLYDFLFLQVMGLPVEIAYAARPALQVLTFWPLAIAWRRFYQGILIWQGKNALIAYGTVCRLATMASIVAVGLIVRTIPGVLLAGLAEGASVIMEMIIVAWWARPLVRDVVLPVLHDPPGTAPLTYRRLFRFYLPLAGTDGMRVVSRPILTAGIARLPNPTLSLAAWSVALGLSSLISSFVMAIQEVTVARMADKNSQRPLMNFTALIGVGFTVFAALIVFTPLANIYFVTFLQAPLEIVPLAISVSLILIPMALLFAARNFMRGMLIARRHTDVVQWAMLANLISLIVFLVAGMIWDGAEGAIIAAWANLGAQVLELGVIYWLMPIHMRTAHEHVAEPLAAVAEDA